MTEKKKLILSSKLNSDALLRRMKEKQDSFGTDGENTVTFDLSKQQRKPLNDRRGIPVSNQQIYERTNDALTEEELKIRMTAIQESKDNAANDADKSDNYGEDTSLLESESTNKNTSDNILDSNISGNLNIMPSQNNLNSLDNENVIDNIEEKIKNNTTKDELQKSEELSKEPVKNIDDNIRATFAKTLSSGNKLSLKSKSDIGSHVTTQVDLKKKGIKKEKPAETTFTDSNTANNKKTKTLAIDRGTEKRQNKLSINSLLEERVEKIRSMSANRMQRKDHHNANSLNDRRSSIKEVSVPEFITVQELANRAAIKCSEIIKILFSMGMQVTINQTIDADTAEIVLSELGQTCKRERDLTVDEYLKTLKQTDQINIVKRPPIVTVMGHVDHGKTSLLDAIRKTDVISQESGGITQHIGAYQITTPTGRRITFIDTPGHEAFTEMRSRGANITDIVILVVAADDGVKKQTIEAIYHARAAGVNIIVAINKVDKPGATPDKVRQDLLQHNLVLEKFGGDIPDVEVSAKKGINIDKLEEIILLSADLMDIKANNIGFATGIVIESQQKRGLGVVASIIIKEGILKKGDVFVSGRVSGKVRLLINDKGQNVETADPGMPVEVIGFEGTPMPGDDFAVLDSEARAKEISNYRDQKYRESINALKTKSSMETMFQRIEDEKIKKLSVIIKADVHGSVEAIVSSLKKMSNNELAVDVIFAGIGEINENDILLAKASNAAVIGFNVRANAKSREKSKSLDVSVAYYSIVYDLIENVKKMLSGILDPEYKEEIIGNAKIRQVFSVSKVGNIAGCIVIDGTIRRNAKVRLLRENVVIYETTVKSLKIEKNDAREVKEAHECGIMLDGYQDIKVDDVIEFFEIKEIAQTFEEKN